MGVIATAADDKIVRIFDSTTGEELKQLKGHQRMVKGVQWSSEGPRLASCSAPTLRIWDATLGEQVLTLKGHTEYVNRVAWKNSQLVSASVDKNVIIWEAETGEPIKTLSGHTDEVTNVAWSPDGAKVASCSLDCSFKVWDVASGKCDSTLLGHTGPIYSVVFSPDGKKIVSTGDAFGRVWDTATLEQQAVFEGHHTGYVTCASYSPDGNTVATSSNDSTIRLWDPFTGKLKKTFETAAGPISQVAYSVDGTKLTYCGRDAAQVCNAETGEVEVNLPHPHGIAISGITWGPVGFEFPDKPAAAAAEGPAE